MPRRIIQVLLQRTAERVTIAIGLGVVTACVVIAQFVTNTSLIKFLDNTHWTVGYICGAILAWLGVARCTGTLQMTRRWFAIAMSVYAVGQVMWDLQVALEWNPFPGPSDLAFVLLGPIILIGLANERKRNGTLGVSRIALLDGLIASTGVVVLALTLYVPRRGDTPLPQFAFLVAYPVALLSAACFALAFLLHVRPRLQIGWPLMLSGLLVNGVLWMQWNAFTLDNTLADGTFYNVLFSYTAIMCGLGSLHWQCSPTRSSAVIGFCDSVIRLLPPLSVLIATLAVILSLTIPEIPETIKIATIIAALTVTGLSMLRQTFIADDLREARETAEAASRAKSEFLANMSHEIRTPLTAIMGCADVLREHDHTQSHIPERIELLDTIHRAGDHLLRVLSDILDLSKIESGRLTVECVATSLPELFTDIESLLSPRASGKNIRLAILNTGSVPTSVITDPTRLRQIVMNLLGNAIKFTEHGSVSATVSVFREGWRSILRIDIEDTGLGVTLDQAAYLFQPFSQADASVTRKFGGTGLGLTLSRRLARIMGGDVTLERSVPGAGSCFRVEVDVVVPLETTWVDSLRVHRTIAPATMSATLSGRIILAEDGPDNQRLISFYLRKAGATVEVAENGKVALAMIDKAEHAGQPFDLLVSDMQMPEMDGYELARTLRTRGANLPILALTAHAMHDDRQKCIDAGCDDYATKPIDRAVLIDACASLINQKTSAKVARRAA